MPELNVSGVGVLRRTTFATLLSAWLLAGTLDIGTAIVYYAHASKAPTIRLLQGIASGALGNKAFEGGPQTAILGLGLHYAIALVWTVAFFVVFRRMNKLRVNLFVVGMSYGLIVWMVMNLIVLPLSNVRHAPLRFIPSVVAAVILMFCIGLPISLIVGKQLDRQTHAK